MFGNIIINMQQISYSNNSFKSLSIQIQLALELYILQ